MTVGIVLVSHSARLGEAVARLAGEMAGPDLRLAVAAGVEHDPDVLGTDATLVLRAVEEVASGDGVLVLMDLGSAVMSAELARDLLAPEVAEQVRLCDAPLVEGAVAAAVQAATGADLATVEAEARAGLAAKQAHLGTAVPAPAAAPVRAGDGAAPGDEVSERVAVVNRLGLHARPAAHLVELLAAHDAVVTLERAGGSADPVPASSLSALLTLGVRGGDELVVRATGPAAGAALAAVVDLAAKGFGDPPDEALPATALPASAPTAPTTGAAADTAPEVVAGGTLAGLSASPGLAVGPLTLLAGDTTRLPEPPPAEGPVDAAAEHERLDAARVAARAGIEEARDAVAGRAGADGAALVATQLLLLDDPVIVGAAERGIEGDHLTAATAWYRAIGAQVEALRGVDDPYLAERAVDLVAVGREVLGHLTDTAEVPPVTEGVLVAQDLTPALAARLEPDVVPGVVTAAGSPTSHAALVLLAVGIPYVAGVGPAVLRLTPGTTLVVDGTAGRVEVDPSPDRRRELADALARQRRERERLLAAAAGPAATRDGTRIRVEANVGSLRDAQIAGRSGADGIGLLRTELLFADGGADLDEEAQVERLRAVASAVDGPTVVRTFDVGGDKPLAGLDLPAEANPFLGLRGLRLGLARPELLVPQLRALLRVAADLPIRILLPMVTVASEVDAVRVLLEEQRDRLAGAGVPCGRPELGAMVEVPAVAVDPGPLLDRVDFVSIGTNDLTQYVMAAERGNPAVADLADPAAPALLRLVATVCDEARRRGRTVAVCGGAAADPVVARLLVGSGVRELSVPPGEVPRVKELVRELALDEAVAIAERARRCPDAAAVRALLA